MNAHQRSETNNQSSNGGNALAESSSRADQEGVPQTATAGQGLPAGLPKSPAGHHLAADQKMDDDTGLSNTANRQDGELDQNERQAQQEQQSNVGRRSDGTPD